MAQPILSQLYRQGVGPQLGFPQRAAGKFLIFFSTTSIGSYSPSGLSAIHFFRLFFLILFCSIEMVNIAFIRARAAPYALSWCEAMAFLI
jgi:hypothetical protein